MTAHWNVLAEAVQSEMVRRGWSIKELACQTGLSRSAVCNILRGQPSAPTTWADLELILSAGARRLSPAPSSKGGDLTPQR